MKTFTVFALYEENNDARYTEFIEAATPEAAEKKAIRDAPAAIIIAAVVEGRCYPVDRVVDLGITPIKGRGYETVVSSVRVDSHRIRLPHTCPSCNADLRKPDAVRQGDYGDYYWLGRIPRGDRGGSNDYGVAMNHDHGSRNTGTGLEKSVLAVTLQCTNCEHDLWNGFFEKADDEIRKLVKRRRS